MVILELIHAPKPNFVEWLCLLDTEPTQAPLGLEVIHNNRTNRMASAGRRGTQDFYFEKLECFKQAYALSTSAWNNKIGPRFYLVGF